MQDKVVVVTGSSSGFGRAIAKACAAEGATVVVSDVHDNPNPGGFEDDAQLTTVEAIQKGGGLAAYIGCDVTSSDQVAGMVAGAVDAFGRLDVTVNNAGVYRNGKRLHEFTEADLDVCFDVNAKSTFFGRQEAAVKQFLAQGDGGVIINLVSTAGLQGHPNQSVYNISKGAQAQPHPLPGHRVRPGRDPGQRDLPDLREDLADPGAVRRQGLRPGVH